MAWHASSNHRCSGDQLGTYCGSVDSQAEWCDHTAFELSWSGNALGVINSLDESYEDTRKVCSPYTLLRKRYLRSISCRIVSDRLHELLGACYAPHGC